MRGGMSWASSRRAEAGSANDTGLAYRLPAGCVPHKTAEGMDVVVRLRVRRLHLLRDLCSQHSKDLADIDWHRAILPPFLRSCPPPLGGGHNREQANAANNR